METDGICDIQCLVQSHMLTMNTDICGLDNDAARVAAEVVRDSDLAHGAMVFQHLNLKGSNTHDSQEQLKYEIMHTGYVLNDDF